MSRQDHFDAGAGKEPAKPVSPNIVYTANKHSTKDAPTGNRSSFAGGHASLTVTDPDGKIVALYKRQRGYRSVETTARYTHPEGNDVVFYSPGKHKNVRDRWVSEVSDVFGVKF